MVKYKNWYLAGEPGMKDERKKLKLITQLSQLISLNKA